MAIARLFVFIIMIPVFAYSFFSTGVAGSYIMLKDNWKDYIVFTPESATSPQHIYEIDKFLYAFQSQPILSIISVTSFVTLLSILIYWVVTKSRNKKLITA